MIAEEIDKLLDAGFVQKVIHPSRIMNVILIKKMNDRWKICINFIDLNKACRKDSYPLPSIDQLVDTTSGHELPPL